MQIFNTLKHDLPASIVVFFVALPLCLGIALASGAPLFSGLIAGIVGGIIVGILSGSQIGVSGPAAGLAAIVLDAIGSFGDFEIFLVAVVLGGLIQIVFGLLKAGVIGYYFPSSVIKGMLTGIGIIIILKQIPYFFGYLAPKGESTSMQLYHSLTQPGLGSLIIGGIGLAILILWNTVFSKKGKIFQWIQGPLVAVVVGILFYVLAGKTGTLAIDPKSLVQVPVPSDTASFLGQFSFPNFSALGNLDIWITAFTIALVASLETLLCVEATDKIDPRKRITPTNRELLAQGAGNMISGFLGGLPVTQVIVRSSANIQSGGVSKLSAIVHGVFLLLSIILIPTLLNLIPLSVLAAILLVVGYKLAKPETFKQMWQLGWKQFVPFVLTILGIVAIDLLWGIGLGLFVGILVILYESYQSSYRLVVEKSGSNSDTMHLEFGEHAFFLNKSAVFKELEAIPKGTDLTIDMRKSKYIDHDILEIIHDFSEKAEAKQITIKLLPNNRK